ncbi:MAG: tRNA lysidine(34) synthetase TilS [Clostridia bacterium]|nr:tRNA lysidine(34) synthetase TilS [Clostridia bacterium]
MSRNHNIDKLFDKAINDFGMLDGAEKIVAGLSGGADSVVLLHKLCEIRERNGLEIIAAHVNHMIRGAEADSDESFCRALCSDLGVEIEVLRTDVPAIAKERKKGLEETARDERYSFFRSLLKKYDAQRIAVAHNADDLAETVLFNITRGSGLNGLTAMKPVRDDVIRPLIYCPKSEIIGYCRENSYGYVVDSTNSDKEYTRNRIRHDVIPVLKDVNPSFLDSVIGLALSVSADNEYLGRQAADYSFSRGRKELSKLEDSLLSRVIINELSKSGASPESKHIKKVCELIRCEKTRASVSVPGGTVRVDRDGVFFAMKEAKIIFDPVRLVDGPNVIGNVVLSVHDHDPGGNKVNSVRINRSIYESGLFVRSRLPGDRYRLHGQTKMPKKLFQEKKYTEEQKKKCLIVCDGSGKIIWITGFPVSDGCSSNKDCIYITYETKEIT